MNMSQTESKQPPPELLPLESPSFPIQRPLLPNPKPRIAFTAPSSSSQSQQWIATSHFFPAAWPRSHHRSARSDAFTPLSPLTSFDPLPNDPKDAKAQERRRRAADFDTWKETCGATEELARAQVTELATQARSSNHLKRIAQAKANRERQLWSCVQRIVPVDQESFYDSAKTASPNGQGSDETEITLIVSHANGFHKEIWEPTLGALVQQLHGSSQSSGRISVKEIWSFDYVSSGEAATLNLDNLGDVISWLDHPRDVFQFMDNFLPSTSQKKLTSAAWLPNFLEPTDGRASAKKRKFVLLGHSLGGATLSMVMGHRPNAFEGLVLVDPAFVSAKLDPTEIFYSIEDVPLARGAIARKDFFESIVKAREYLSSKPYFRTWDAQVLELHLRFGLRPIGLPQSKALVANDLDDKQLGRVVLTWSNSKWHEAATFASTFLGRHGIHTLQNQRFSGWVGLINMQGGFNNTETTALVGGLRKGISWTIEGNHLVAQEEPQRLGEILAKMIRTQSSDEGRKQEKLLSRIQKPKL